MPWDKKSKDIFWARVIREIGEYGVIALDIEITPPVGDGIFTPEHKIKAIGIYILERDEPIIWIEDEEAKLLYYLNKFFYDYEPSMIIGYGIYYLDIPFILYKVRQYRRKWYYILEVLERTPILELVHPTKIFLYQKTGEFKYWKLREVAEILGLPKEEYEPEKINNPTELKRYLENDLKSIVELYRILVREYYNKII